MSAWLLVKAWTEFAYLDLVRLRGFRSLRQAVKRTVTRNTPPPPGIVDDVVAATETAAVFYFKAVRCLQRSAVATRLLRRRGVSAELVIGCQMIPLRGHAWVEVSGDAILEQTEDLPYFHVVDRW